MPEQSNTTNGNSTIIITKTIHEPSRSTESPLVLEAEKVGRQGLLRYVVISGAAVVAGSLLLQRYSPKYRSLRTTTKVFLGTIVATAYWGYQAEANMARYHREQQRKHSWIQVPERRSILSSWHDYLEEYRYPIIGGIWGVTMVGALAISFSQRNLKFSQKLIHARMYAQFATVCSLLVTAYLLSPSDFGAQPKRDRHSEWVAPPSQYANHPSIVYSASATPKAIEEKNE